MSKTNNSNSKITVEMQAPDFSGYVAEDIQISNQQFAGKYVVLYFYPKDSTAGCTTEANDFNDLKEDFDQNNSVIIGVSKDSLKSHQKFIDKYSLQFQLISDEECVVCNNYGVWVEKSMYGKKYMGIQRATFLINPDGNIAHIWPKVSVKGHAKEVLNKIQELSNLYSNDV